MPKRVVFAFLSLMASAFLIYFFALGMSEPTATIVKYMNDAHKSKTCGEWAVFIVGALLFTGIWCGLWVWFKRSEKICVDHFCRIQSTKY